MSEAGRDLIDCDELLQRISSGEARVIDVRAPVEYKSGSIPGSINLPILNDQERAQVGTVYKTAGSAAAVELGHALVSGAHKEARVQAWTHAIQASSRPTFVTCFRGGLRSRLAQQWIADGGVKIPRLEGGYKKMRRHLMNLIANFGARSKVVVLSGKTGAGKTQVLSKLDDVPLLNLESLAKHRGSAFGAQKDPQPTQIDFENALAVELHRLLTVQGPVVVEDESRMIGEIVVPAPLFTQMRASPVVLVDEPLEVRVENTFQEYVESRRGDPQIFLNHRASLGKIKNRLGGLRYAEILEDMARVESAYRQHGDLSLAKVWIFKLLNWYYDPLYIRSWEKRQPEVLFAGTQSEVVDFLREAFGVTHLSLQL